MSIAAPVLVMIVAGAAISLQSLFSGTLGQRLGVAESVVIVHLGGFLLGALILLLVRGGNLSAWRTVPWYVYSAGALGVLIVGAYSYAVSKIGLAPAITLAIVVQLVLSTVLDHFGMFGLAQRPFDLTRGIGVAVLLAGTWLVLR